MSEPSPPDVLHLYAWGYEAGRHRVTHHPDDNVTSIGQAQYGARYSRIVIHPTARNRIAEAMRIVEWAHQLTCRFDPVPKELADLLGIDVPNPFGDTSPSTFEERNK